MAICELLNISKSFKSKNIFDNFSLKIEEGDFVCITGESGTGKSTLLNMIGLLESPDKGMINLCGYNDVKISSKIAQQILRNKIGFLFQNFGLIDDKSVGDNLDIVCKNTSIPKTKWKHKQEEILQELQLNVSLTQKVYNLSGGEQQRVALARLLLKNCEIILADEPTGSLDVSNRNLVLDILDRLNQAGKTIIIVTHDPYIVNRYKNIIKL